MKKKVSCLMDLSVTTTSRERISGFFKHLFCTSALILMMQCPALAAPVYITLTGNITAISDYDNDTSYMVGDEVTNTFMIDRERDGYLVDANGTTLLSDNKYYGGFEDVYYAEYVGGDGLDTDDMADNGVAYHYGTDYENTSRKGQFIIAEMGALNNPYGKIEIERKSDGWMSDTFDSYSYEIGDGFILVASDGFDTVYWANVTVTAIREDHNPSQPVPEPSTLVLLGLGLACVAGVRRSKTTQ